MAKLDLSLLEPYFQKGENFELTEAQYEEKVKKPYPKQKLILEKPLPWQSWRQNQDIP